MTDPLISPFSAKTECCIAALSDAGPLPNATKNPALT
jgi:hypothetical protein